jgi:hypothetical protein
MPWPAVALDRVCVEWPLTAGREEEEEEEEGLFRADAVNEERPRYPGVEDLFGSSGRCCSQRSKPDYCGAADGPDTARGARNEGPYACVEQKIEELHLRAAELNEKTWDCDWQACKAKAARSL